MPIYIYQNPITEECIEVVQSMNDEHKYIDEKGLEWKRVFISSQLKTESSINPWSKNDFVEKTKNVKGSYGDMLDRSAELSSKRADQNGGIDPIKQKYFSEYSKKRGGAKHVKDKTSKKENKKFNIDY
jgi:predicted nucleic acid-binding Zn ribbon protein